MYTLFLSLLLTFFITDNNQIKGKITDKLTGEELTGVRVVLNQNDTIYTDFNGNFTLDVKDSINVLVLNFISYKEEIEHFKTFNTTFLTKK